ncbi:N-acetylmuramic acid 6-phosphate etherase [Microbacterium sp. zg.Y909]|uniref:N-acetylmuramic acid 6-phosphate etherase n=1 Tax=Microbacterium sp. zg.Y909 TaxID=2969413 RepID=UPI00214AA077|nr:N-acetylmuramic acid 6-phosphate etherase [Microbacterium sp. zg.Y909]MCR2826572.1 N-acetylmuramic acid 6-phosphate etherase [Microbacterium sp. zg.Y909]
MPAHPHPLSPTELRLEASADLDALAGIDVLRLLNAQDRVAVDAVEAILPQLAEVVDIAAERFRRGGTVHYFGAGTSGRLGVLDAAELLPTFNLEPGRVIGHIAGGHAALVKAVEDAEDSEADGAADASGVGRDDVVIGLAASGNTPYVGGALAAARTAGAYTVLVSSNPNAALAPLADANIVVDTGPEVLTGSTRLKAATAEKLVLNGFSTALMVAVGRTWSNLMVSVVATNAKLRLRTVRILQQAAGLDEQAARDVLAAADGELKTAIVAALADVAPTDARALLAGNDGSVRAALAAASADAAPRTTESYPT